LFHDGDPLIWTYPVPRASAAEQWRTLRDLVPETGHWPLLIGGENLEIWQEHSEVSVADELRQAAEIDPAAWFAHQAEDMAGDEEVWPEPSPWPDEAAPSHGFYFTERDGKSSLHMALLPTTRGWEAPAWVGFGDWNACPSPAEHVALMRHWETKYGAEVVCIDRDVLEMHVSRPPNTREEAMALAREQFLYCDDIVYQGTETLEALAATLLGGTTWFFWWD
jgi:hypothetical protein